MYTIYRYLNGRLKYAARFSSTQDMRYHNAINVLHATGHDILITRTDGTVITDDRKIYGYYNPALQK